MSARQSLQLAAPAALATLEPPSCGICLSALLPPVEPVSLSCGHSWCRGCCRRLAGTPANAAASELDGPPLQLWVRVRCPACRRCSDLPRDLPVNIILRDLLAALHGASALRMRAGPGGERGCEKRTAGEGAGRGGRGEALRRELHSLARALEAAEGPEEADSALAALAEFCDEALSDPPRSDALRAAAGTAAEAAAAAAGALRARGAASPAAAADACDAIAALASLGGGGGAGGGAVPAAVAALRAHAADEAAAGAACAALSALCASAKGARGAARAAGAPVALVAAIRAQQGPGPESAAVRRAAAQALASILVEGVPPPSPARPADRPASSAHDHIRADMLPAA
eukprot:tig00021072_g17988.t1